MFDYVFAVIVTFEPDLSLLKKNIHTIKEVGANVIVVDNSVNNKVKEGFLKKDIILLNLNQNKGIASAQNIGIKEAISRKAQIIAFFDQDSEITKDLLYGLFSSFSDEMDIASPLAISLEDGSEYPNLNIKKSGAPKYVYSQQRKEKYCVDIVISSGMCIRSSVFEKVGFFDEDFFIDFVDIDFCYRCKKRNISIWVLPNVIMKHKIGLSKKRFGFLKISVHSPQRTYYKVRNTFLLRKKKFPFIFVIRQIVSAMFKNFVLTFAGEKRKAYRHYYYAGLFDGMKKKTGSYESNHKS